MQERTTNLVVVILILVMIAIMVVIGVQGKSAWVSILAAAGTIIFFIGIGSAGKRRFGGFWICAIIGLAAVGAGIWIGHMAGRVWWAALLFLLSMFFFSHAISMNNTFNLSSSIPSILIGFILFLSSLGGPWWLNNALTKTVEVTPAPTAQVNQAVAATPIPEPGSPPVERGDFFPGLWDFLARSLKSGWGILYMAIVILLGRIWLGKWGWLIAPILLILAAGVLAWIKPGGAEPLTAFFTTAPLVLIKSALTTSIRQFGSAAWGAVFCGVGLVFLLLPAYIHMYSANRAVVQAQKVRQMLGTTIAANLLRGQYTPYTSLVSIVTVVASLTGFILIWKALSSVAAASGALGFPLLGVPDISLPRWKPIWQWPYFLNAGVYALVSLIATGIQRRMGLALVSVNWFLILLGSFLMSLFVPAGVITFLTGQSLVLCLVAPLSLLKKTKLPRPPAPTPPLIDQERLWVELQRRMAEQAAEREAQEVEMAAEEIAGVPPVPVWQEPQEETPLIELEEEEEEVSEMKAETLVDHGYTIVEMIPDGSGPVLILDDYGDVYRCHGDGDESELASFTMDEPIGLAAVSGGRIAAIDRPGKLFFTGGSPETIDTAFPILGFTVNSFGTILAYISPDSSIVRGLILAAAKDQLFIDCGETLTAIAFSTDNRYLGIGTTSGKILVFDMASRKIAQTLASANLRNVTYLRPTPGGWVGSYDNSRVVAWDNQGNLLQSTGAYKGVTCLAVDPHSGNIAYGNNLGEITILNPQFDDLLVASLHNEDIVSATFESTGNSIVTAGIDGAVRRINF